MKSITLLTHLLVIARLLCPPLTAQAQDKSRDFQNLFTLLGTWQMKTAKGDLYESWKKVNSTTLISKSFKLTGSDTLVLEHVEVQLRNNQIFYMPLVKDQNQGQRVTFIMVTADNGVYIFENKEHDFPQRIIYTLPKDQKMTAWIEGNVNGKFKKSEFNYTKAF